MGNEGRKHDLARRGVDSSVGSNNQLGGSGGINAGDDSDAHPHGVGDELDHH